MADEYLVEPDTKFIKQVIDSGGESLKKCFQCATCSVMCSLSPDTKPFPRKEMIWAQWGLKDRLVKDPDVWLCHQCGDCTAYCPRGAKPGDVLSSLRSCSAQHYAFPKFLGKALSEAKYLPLLFAIPVIILLAVLSAIGHLNIPAGEIVFSKFVPIKYVDAVFMTVTGFVLLSLAIGLSRFWKDINVNQSTPKGNFLKTFFSALIEILTHSRFKKCEVNKIRYYAHLGIFYGFIGLFIVANFHFISLYVFGKLETPMPLLNPVKMFANLSALVLFVGLTLVIYNRLTNKEASRGTYYDWALILAIYAIAISGILTEVARLADIATLAYPLYFVHLVFVFYLIAYLPYSKLAHLLYRTTAMVYEKYSQRDVKGFS
ncbi:MAG: quinone-interacting membrane-bound oxidoreductase complex subunit QmoC [Thermodesulfovibrionales bacterium]|nr:quinone-interacting membrane-bound oxidoreductase complex subunit QmoC [Thermodesulfovibrionales bacterium]